MHSFRRSAPGGCQIFVKGLLSHGGDLDVLFLDVCVKFFKKSLF